ncbi:MAG: ATP-binding protein, partial [Natronomonas sp.]
MNNEKEEEDVPEIDDGREPENDRDSDEVPAVDPDTGGVKEDEPDEIQREIGVDESSETPSTENDVERGEIDDGPDHTLGRTTEPSDRLDEDESLIDGDLGSKVEVEGDIEIDESQEDSLLGGLQIDSTDDIEVPDRLVDQVIGQDHARDIILKAAKQRRHVMMIGSPGTGKSMLAKA